MEMNIKITRALFLLLVFTVLLLSVHSTLSKQKANVITYSDSDRSSESLVTRANHRDGEGNRGNDQCDRGDGGGDDGDGAGKQGAESGEKEPKIVPRIVPKPAYWNSYAEEGLRLCRAWVNKDSSTPARYPKTYRFRSENILETSGISGSIDDTSTLRLLHTEGISTAEADWWTTDAGSASASVNLKDGVIIIAKSTFAEECTSRRFSAAFWWMWLNGAHRLLPELAIGTIARQSHITLLWRTDVQGKAAEELFNYILRDNTHNFGLYRPDKSGDDPEEPEGPDLDNNPFYAILGSPFGAPLMRMVTYFKSELRAKPVVSISVAKTWKRAPVKKPQVDKKDGQTPSDESEPGESNRWDVWMELGEAQANTGSWRGPHLGANGPVEGSGRSLRKRPTQDQPGCEAKAAKGRRLRC